jgi:hypothetical protein
MRPEGQPDASGNSKNPRQYQIGERLERRPLNAVPGDAIGRAVARVPGHVVAWRE